MPAGTICADDSAQVRWATPTLLSALGAEIVVDDPDRNLGPLLAALSPLVQQRDAAPGSQTVYVCALGRECWSMRRGYTGYAESSTLMGLLGPLLHQLNVYFSNASPLITVHAAGVAKGDAGVLISAPSGAGKSTLTAGLVLAGLSYLGDEAIGIRPDGSMVPYAKPLTIDPGAHYLFPTLERFAVEVDSGDHPAWNVPVQRLRADAISDGAALRHVVFTRYAPDESTRLAPISRANALIDLADATFGFRERSRHALDELAAAIEHAECHTLVVSDLWEAVELVSDLVGHRVALAGCRG